MSRLGCPKCGKPPTIRCYDLIGCRACNIAWGDGFDEQDIDRARDDVKFLASCEWKPFVRDIPPAISLSEARVRKSGHARQSPEPEDHDRVIGTISAVMNLPRRAADADDDDIQF